MKTRTRKPYRTIRIHDSDKPYHGISADLILEIYPNGLIEIWEKGRRTRRATTVTSIYFSCIMREIAKKPRKRRRLRP